MLELFSKHFSVWKDKCTGKAEGDDEDWDRINLQILIKGHLHIMIRVGNVTTTMMIMSRTMIIVMVMLMPIWAEWWKAISRVSWEDVNYNDDDDDDEGDGDNDGDGDVDADMGGMMESNITGILRGMCVPPPSALSQPALTSARNCHQHHRRRWARWCLQLTGASWVHSSVWAESHPHYLAFVLQVYELWVLLPSCGHVA